MGSLEVLRGEGGVTPSSGPEKALARANALKSLAADGYRLTGTLEIRARTRPRRIDVRAADMDDTWQVSCHARVRHSEFGIKHHSMFIGSMKVADDVSVSCTESRPKDGVTAGAG